MDVTPGLLAPACAAAILAGSTSARAEPASESARGGPSLGRPHTMAVLEAGVIALPSAPISAGQRGGATPFGTIGNGDATLQTGMRLLYRGDPAWAIGAGAMFGPSPTSDNEYGGLRGLKRTHARSYLAIDFEGRYIPLRVADLEAWVGFTSGVVVVADRYATDQPTPPSFLGAPSVTVRTEGLSFGAQLGGTWHFAERWGLGLTTRFARWFLPRVPTCTPIGDCGTLTGSVDAISAGLTIGYRLPL